VAGLHPKPLEATDVYKGDLAVYELVCAPLLQPDETYGCSKMEAWSLAELQRIPAVGLSDVAAATFPTQEAGIMTILVAVSRKSYASISSYDQSSYDVPSFVYIWNATTSKFDVLQVRVLGFTMSPACLGETTSPNLAFRITVWTDEKSRPRQELGASFRSVPGRVQVYNSRGGRTDDENMVRAFCHPQCELAEDNKTYSVKYLRGATGEKFAVHVR